ncbi:MAG: radical SAM family heme chaperone HemW [Bacteroidales bacterium]|nr:radical SAM family heme chaperone HemW [Bacteroidales bacterium]
MAGIYVHIPFCAQLCYYCDFHFSLQLKHRSAMITALCKELEMRKNFFVTNSIQTIYFGGGTPSLLMIEEVSLIINTIRSLFNVDSDAEISFECNPDDMTLEYMQGLRSIGINRVSIGIQSFVDEELVPINRRHTSAQAQHSITTARQAGFRTISIDLIYGLPKQTLDSWKTSLEIAQQFDLHHISTYCLTVEKNTALNTFVRKNTIQIAPEPLVLQQFEYLQQWARANDFEHYELSNFARAGAYSRHNTSYWQQKPYLGIGPSAHSYNGRERLWNIAHNQKYIDGISSNNRVYEREELSIADRYNEYILTSLRTMWGVSMEYAMQHFPEFFVQFSAQVKKHESKGNVIIENEIVALSPQALLIADSIIADFFVL